MKTSDTNLAKFYGLTRQTIATYRKEHKKRYNALREYFEKQVKQSK